MCLLPSATTNLIIELKSLMIVLVYEILSSKIINYCQNVTLKTAISLVVDNTCTFVFVLNDIYLALQPFLH